MQKPKSGLNTYLMGYAFCRRPPIIAHCFRIADSWHCCKRILSYLGRKLVIWHDWWLHFGVLGDPGLILCHWGAYQRTLWGPGLDFYRFLVDFGAHGCHLACLLPLLYRPGGPWDDPGTILGRPWDIGGHKEGPCELQAWILLIFCWFRGPILKAFWVLLEQKRIFLHIYFQVAFSNICWV